MAATDIITILDARVAAGYSPADQTHDVRLAELVTAVSGRIDEWCGPVVARTITEYRDGGRPYLMVRSRPLRTITSVTEHTGGVATVLTAETVTTEGTYWAEPDEDGTLTGWLWRRSGFTDAYFPPGRGNVVVVASAGRYATAAAAAESPFAEAAKQTIRYLWRAEQDATAQVDGYDVPSFSFPTMVLPKVVQETLAAHRKISVG